MPSNLLSKSEETVPVMLDGVEEGKAMLRVLPDGEAGALADGLDLLERLGQLRPRDHAVHDVKVW